MTYAPPPTLTPSVAPVSEFEIFSLDEIKSKYREVKQLDNMHWVAYWWNPADAKDNTWLDWKFLQFHMSDGDGSNAFVEIICQGNGPTSMRELRHTNWGENGYLFYPPFKAMRLLIDDLEQYYDLD